MPTSFRKCRCVLCMELRAPVHLTQCLRHEFNFGTHEVPLESSFEAFFKDHESSSEDDHNMIDAYDDDSNSDDSKAESIVSSSTDSDEYSSSTDEEEKGVTERHIIEFARELYELVLVDGMKEVTLQKCLKAFHALLQKAGYEEEFQDVPSSVYLINKWASEDTDPVYSVLLDICPTRDHYVFEHNSGLTHCPKCGKERTM